MGPVSLSELLSMSVENPEFIYSKFTPNSDSCPTQLSNVYLHLLMYSVAGQSLSGRRLLSDDPLPYGLPIQAAKGRKPFSLSRFINDALACFSCENYLRASYI